MEPLPLFLCLFLLVYVRADMNDSRQSSTPNIVFCAYFRLQIQVYAQSLIVPNMSKQCSLSCDTVQQPPTTASIANVSSQFLINTSSQETSSNSASAFSYIIPYGQTQNCDIYGSPCQTGSITVGVNLTTATTTTVLPCSSYLSAQYTYIWNQTWFHVPTLDNPASGNKGEGWSNGDVDPWGTNFGQSPQCRSYAEALRRGQSIFSDCAISNTSIQTDGKTPAIDLLQNYPGLVRYFDPDDDDSTGLCCGNCSLDISEVKLYYFPDKSTVNCQNISTSNLTSTLPARDLEKRVHSLVASGSTVVVKGYTL